MFSLIIKRVLLVIPTIWVVATIVFLVMRVVPGDPAIVILGNYATEESLQKLHAQLGLNMPLWQQYIDFLGNIARGNLGRSLINNKPVFAQLRAALPYTSLLALEGIVIGAILGIPLGIISSTKRNSFIDSLSRVFAFLGLSFPAFYLGILLLLFFAVRLHWFPVISGEMRSLGDWLYRLFLPSLSLGLIQAASVTRVTRSAMLEVLAQNYVTTARSKGIAERWVIYKHALRNALIPVITLMGLQIGALLGGAILTETVFNIPGVGKLLVGAITQRDYPVIQSGMMVYAAVVVTVNLIVDLTYGFIDPQVRYE